jgi:hypothetical protein
VHVFEKLPVLFGLARFGVAPGRSLGFASQPDKSHVLESVLGAPFCDCFCPTATVHTPAHAVCSPTCSATPDEHSHRVSTNSHERCRMPTDCFEWDRWWPNTDHLTSKKKNSIANQLVDHRIAKTKYNSSRQPAPAATQIVTPEKNYQLCTLFGVVPRIAGATVQYDGVSESYFTCKSTTNGGPWIPADQRNRRCDSSFEMFSPAV